MSSVVIEAPILMTQEVLQTTYPAQYLRSLQNRAAPVSKLPVEILLRIFTSASARDIFYNPRMTLRRITEVCRDWRDIAIGAPLLWTRCLSSSRPKWTTLALQRSQLARMAPFEIDLDLRGGISDISKTLLAHTSHASRLEITGPALRLIDAQELVEGDTPFLKELKIFCTENHDSGAEDEPAPAFKLSSTKFLHSHGLRRLELHKVDIDFNSTLLQNLTTLSLHRVSPESLPTWSQLVDMLYRMPLLGDLTLEHVFPPVDSSAHNIKPVCLLLLESLIIKCVTASQMQTILSYLFFLSPNYLQLRWDEDDVGHVSTLRVIGARVHAKRFGKHFEELSVELAPDSKRLDFTASISLGDGPLISVSVPNSAEIREEVVIADLVDFLCFKSLTKLELNILKECSHDALLHLTEKMPFLEEVTIYFFTAFDFFEVLGMTSGKSHSICLPHLKEFNFMISNFLGREEWVENDAMEVLKTRREHGAELEDVSFYYVHNLSPEMAASFEEVVDLVEVRQETGCRVSCRTHSTFR